LPVRGLTRRGVPRKFGAMKRTCLALLSLPLALTACQRTAPADANASAPQPPGANRLMARGGGDRRERADTRSDARIRCKEAVASIPCAP